VRAIIKLAECPHAVGQVFNIGSTEEVTILELAKKVLNLTNSHGRPHTADHLLSSGLRQQSSGNGQIVFIPYDQAYETGFEDMRRRVPDIDKIKAMVGWEPQVPLNETLQGVIAFHQRWEHHL
ncbi:MAG: hypothetical protein HY709_03880, partial [Candidatus Latescibacteria bacterium]|nr:hypothetical protein [Candidatus Latescibacterota bacterium]